MKLHTLFICTALFIAAAVFVPSAGYAQQKEIDSTATALLFNGLKEYNSGNYGKAREHLQKLAAISPNNDAAYYYLANIAIKSDDAPSGELYLKKGIELDPENFWYRETLGQLYIKHNKIAEAIKIYEELLEMYPKKSAVYYSLVNLYLGTQQTAQAKEMLEKIEAVQGKSEDCHDILQHLQDGAGLGESPQLSCGV